MNKKYFLLCFLVFFLFSSVSALTDTEILDRINILETELSNLRSLLVKEDCHSSALWSWDYCSSDCKCKAGEGDCNSNDECLTGYCALDVGTKYGQLRTIDVCEGSEVVIAPKQEIVLVETVPQKDVLIVKGNVFDLDSKEPLSGVEIYSGADLLAISDKLGKFEVKLDKEKDLDVSFKDSGYLPCSLSFCQNCKGYNESLSLSLFEQKEKVFPVLGKEIEIGGITLKKALNLKLYSDRFVKAEVQYQNKEGKLITTYTSDAFSQHYEINDAFPIGYFSRVKLEDRQGNEYFSSFQQAKTSVLSFLQGNFLWGVCGNNVCEKEENTCPSDCNDCTETDTCSFSCKEGSCKKDIALSFPNGSETLEMGQKYIIEWGQIGLENEDLDLELLAYDKSGSVVNDFFYLIATSVGANLGQYEWEAPNLDDSLNYKVVLYNKMCLGGSETLVSCMKDRYLDRSDEHFFLKEKAPSLPERELASISQAAQKLAEVVKLLLDNF